MGGESGVMCWKFSEVEKIEYIFSIFSVKNSTNIHLSQRNASAEFEQLNRFLNDAKVSMPTSKLKMNPDKTEFIIFDFEETEGQVESMFSN